MDMVKRFEVYWVNLDPTIGSEIAKSRPAVVISGDEMNEGLNTVIVAPLTSTRKDYPTRIDINFSDKNGQVVLDQIRTVDKQRLVNLAGTLEADYQRPLCDRLVDMFVY